MSDPQRTPPWSQDAFARAFMYAARVHGDQRYPGTELSYVCHLAQVAQEVMAALAVEEHPDGDLALQCACLHDTLEDAGVIHAQLRERFGGPVADGVQALSKDEAAAEGAEGPERKRRMMDDSLGRIQAQPRAVWLVKLGDRISNLQAPPGYWPVDKRRRYREEAGRILAALGAASPLLAARLERRIADYVAFCEPPAGADAPAS